MWHWKSVRTGSALAERMDDNHFGAPLDVDPDEKRYTGGYTQDPSDGGGYAMNWESFDEDRVVPRFLPADVRMLERLVDVDADPDASDAGQYWPGAHETVPYDAASDDLPVGTVMPSVIVKGPHEGDRGDVHAVAAWADGTWTIEARRPLDTGSEFDVAFASGEPLYLWLAAFDHAQTRHTYHLRPVRVVLHGTGDGHDAVGRTAAVAPPR